jgi:hypothetical protein
VEANSACCFGVARCFLIRGGITGSVRPTGWRPVTVWACPAPGLPLRNSCKIANSGLRACNPRRGGGLPQHCKSRRTTAGRVVPSSHRLTCLVGTCQAERGTIPAKDGASLRMQEDAAPASGTREKRLAWRAKKRVASAARSMSRRLPGIRLVRVPGSWPKSILVEKDRTESYQKWLTLTVAMR